MSMLTVEQMVQIVRDRFGEVRDLRVERHKNFVLAKFIDANGAKVDILHRDTPNLGNMPAWAVHMWYGEKTGLAGEGNTLNEAFVQIRDRKMERLVKLTMIDVPIQRSNNEEHNNEEHNNEEHNNEEHNNEEHNNA